MSSLRSRRSSLASAVWGLALAAALALSASTAQAADTCPNAKYRTGPSLKLPDCRAYELVTPAVKANEVAVWSGSTNPAKISADGKTVAYLTATGPMAEDAADGIPTWERAVRTDNGWTAKRALLPSLGSYTDAVSGRANWLIANENLDRFFFYSSRIYFPSEQPFTGNSQINGGAFLGNDEYMDWVSRPTSPTALPAQGTTEARGQFFVPISGSKDLRAAYFTSLGTLTPEDDLSGRLPYESWSTYKYENGQLRNAGVLPDGSISKGGSVSAALEPTPISANLTSVTAPTALDVERIDANPVSHDGQSFLFVSPDPMRAAQDPTLPKPQLYMAAEGEETRLISAPEHEDEPIAGSAGVVGVTARYGGPFSRKGWAIATPDHSVVIFSTSDALTGDAPDDNSIAKTYRYDAASGALTYLSDLDRPVAANSGFGQVLSLSPSGNLMLYVNASGHLKLWQKDGPVRLISDGVQIIQNDAGNRVVTHFRYSADEEVLVINANGALRGEPNHTPGSGATYRAQVYRYEIEEDALECISCLEGGTPGTASISVWGPRQGFSLGNEASASPGPNRGMNEDASRIFFTSTTALLPEDRNTVADVYQWHNGELTLLSNGSPSSRGQRLLDTNSDGSTVFITSDQQLVPADNDEYIDIYAVRVNGGFDPPQAASSDSGCSGDDCQGAPGEGPDRGTIASDKVRGTGNVASERKASLRVGRVKRLAVGAATVTVRVSGSGRLVVAGQAIRSASRVVSGSGRHSIQVRLKPHAQRQLRHRGVFRTSVRITFRSGDGAVSRTARMTFRKPKA